MRNAIHSYFDSYWSEGNAPHLLRRAIWISLLLHIAFILGFGLINLGPPNLPMQAGGISIANLMADKGPPGAPEKMHVTTPPTPPKKEQEEVKPDPPKPPPPPPPPPKVSEKPALVQKLEPKPEETPKPKPLEEPKKMEPKKDPPKKEEPKKDPPKKEEPKKDPPKKDPPKDIEPIAPPEEKIDDDSLEGDANNEARDAPKSDKLTVPNPTKTGISMDEALPGGLNGWGSQVQKKVYRAWSQPGGVKLDPENQAWIRVVVSSDGQIIGEPVVVKPGNNPALARSAIQAILAAVPFPPFPAIFTEPEQEVTFVFTLQP